MSELSKAEIMIARRIIKGVRERADKLDDNFQRHLIAGSILLAIAEISDAVLDAAEALRKGDQS